MSLAHPSLKNGKLVVHLGNATMTEEQWDDAVREVQAFMSPVWDERQKAADAAHAEQYRREHNIQEHTEILEGVEVTVTTQGANNEVCGARVGDYETPRIRASRVMTGSGKATLWNAEIFDPKLSQFAYGRHTMATLRNKRGGAIAFKTPQAAMLAAIRQELMAEAI